MQSRIHGSFGNHNYRPTTRADRVAGWLDNAVKNVLTVGGACLLVGVLVYFFYAGLVGFEANSADVRRIVEGQGYKNVTITGYRYWGGGDHDIYRSGFEATDARGNHITGVVSGGWMKSYTLRLD